jgi:hypothetical protein
MLPLDAGCPQDACYALMTDSMASRLHGLSDGPERRSLSAQSDHFAGRLLLALIAERARRRRHDGNRRGVSHRDFFWSALTCAMRSRIRSADAAAIVKEQLAGSP